MSKYTIVLYQLLDTGFDIGLNDYPIYNEAYRNVLNKKIIDHYAFWEIGFETPTMFKMRLNTKMREIMPYYNRLYNLNLAQILGINNVNMDETHTTTNVGSSDNKQSTQSNTDATSKKTGTLDSTTSDDGKNRSVGSSLPQSLVTVTDIEGGLYASDATISDSSNTTSVNDSTTNNSTDNSSTTGTANSTTQATNTEEFTKNLMGMDGKLYPIEAWNLLTAKIVDIDLMIIDQLSEMFMNVW